MPEATAHIVQLPAVLANQIAAGEVVERPASVVKELLENAIDAGATRIRVDVEEGGVRLVRVTDDGAGIEPGELVLALSRHATSKLCSFDDLGRVTTLGFRGEALPSIASVARLSLTSRRRGASTAWQLEVEGAAVDGEPVPARGDPGTVVEVRDLFYNTPARRRFLRTTRTEYLHIEEVVRRAALATPGVSFELHRDGRRTLRARAIGPGADGAQRLADLCGAAFAREAFGFEAAGDGLHVRGWLLAGPEGRPHTNLQHLCVNARVVRDTSLRHAVRAAYDGLLTDGRHPGYVIYLEVPAEAVDVNVHPTKHELRFRELRMVHDFVLSAVRHALADARHGAGHEPVADSGAPAPGVSAGGESAGEAVSPGAAAGPVSGATVASPAPAAPAPESDYRPGAQRASHVSGWREVAAYAPLARAPVTRRVAAGTAAGQGVAEAAAHGPAIWLSDRFALLCSDAGEHWLVDLQAVAGAEAAAEFAARLEGQTRVSVPLLLPAARGLDAVQAELLDARLDALAELGLQLRRTGPAEAVMLEVPAAAAHVAPARLWAPILGWLSGAARGEARLAELAERLVEAAADHASAAPPERRQAWLHSVGAALQDGPPPARLARRLDDGRLAALFAAGP